MDVYRYEQRGGRTLLEAIEAEDDNNGMDDEQRRQLKALKMLI